MYHPSFNSSDVISTLNSAVGVESEVENMFSGEKDSLSFAGSKINVLLLGLDVCVENLGQANEQIVFKSVKISDFRKLGRRIRGEDLPRLRYLIHKKENFNWRVTGSALYYNFRMDSTFVARHKDLNNPENQQYLVDVIAAFLNSDNFRKRVTDIAESQSYWYNNVLSAILDLDISIDLTKLMLAWNIGSVSNELTLDVDDLVEGPTKDYSMITTKSGHVISVSSTKVRPSSSLIYFNIVNDWIFYKRRFVIPTDAAIAFGSLDHAVAEFEMWATEKVADACRKIIHKYAGFQDVRIPFVFPLYTDNELKYHDFTKSFIKLFGFYKALLSGNVPVTTMITSYTNDDIVYMASNSNYTFGNSISSFVLTNAPVAARNYFMDHFSFTALVKRADTTKMTGVERSHVPIKPVTYAPTKRVCSWSPIFQMEVFSPFVPVRESSKLGYFADTDNLRFSDFIDHNIENLSGRLKNALALMHFILFMVPINASCTVHVVGAAAIYASLFVAKCFPGLKFVFYDPGFSKNDLDLASSQKNVVAIKGAVGVLTIQSIEAVTPKDEVVAFASDLYLGTTERTLNFQDILVKTFTKPTPVSLKYFGSFLEGTQYVSPLLVSGLYHRDDSTEVRNWSVTTPYSGTNSKNNIVYESTKIAISSKDLDDSIISHALICKRAIYPNLPIHRLFKSRISIKHWLIDCTCYSCTAFKYILIMYDDMTTLLKVPRISLDSLLRMQEEMLPLFIHSTMKSRDFSEEDLRFVKYLGFFKNGKSFEFVSHEAEINAQKKINCENEPAFSLNVPEETDNE